MSDDTKTKTYNSKNIADNHKNIAKYPKNMGDNNKKRLTFTKTWQIIKK